MTINFVSAFAGIGGFEEGFRQAGGFHCTAQIEWKKDRLGVLAEHFEAPQFGDITEVTGADILSATDTRPDLMVGGFPCQDTSIAAPHRAGLAGARSGHFWSFARLVDEVAELADQLDPRWLLIENPPGLLGSHGGQDMERVLHTMVELGYGVGFRVLQSASIPGSGGQRRQRVLILGHRGGDPRPAAQVLALPHRGGEDPDVDHPGRSSARRPSAVGSAEDHGGRLIFRKSRRPRSKDDYATYVEGEQINTLNGYDGGFSARQTNIVIDQGQPRVLTLEEWEMAQGFEPGWTASMKDGARFQAIGDSMNVHLARWFGERLAAAHAALPMLPAAEASA